MGERASDELGRRVSEDERDLWREVKRRHRDSPYDRVRAAEAGRRSCGLHEERARQIVRTWANDGLVEPRNNASELHLTGYGEQFEFDT